MEKDYKKMYLEQKRLALNLEMQLLQMRAREVETEMPGIEEELKTYDCKNKTPDTVKA